MFDPDSDVFDLQRSAGSTGAASGARAKEQEAEEKIVSDKLRHIYVWPIGVGTLTGGLSTRSSQSLHANKV